ncbi:hypothetical protein F5Y12DRAFT_712584 [Xylaria sp. FL1777]|nr:hypothetical protein F5Y12DRAFT_712584 [Xylaria sp. FL1777]
MEAGSVGLLLNIVWMRLLWGRQPRVQGMVLILALVFSLAFGIIETILSILNGVMKSYPLCIACSMAATSDEIDDSPSMPILFKSAGRV